MALVHDSIGDFPLFPRDPTHFEMPTDGEFGTLHYGANARSDYHPHYSESSSYDSYTAASGYSSAAQLYYTAPRYPVSVGKGFGASERQRHTPQGSPSPSISQAFDQPPSTLSSASGASVQSTASSAVGSPYSHAANTLPSHEQWSELRHGLGIAPEIVHNDGFAQDAMFPISGMENDPVFDDSKLQGNFVGESRKISSYSSSSSQPSPSISSRPAFQSFVPVHCSPPSAMARDTSSSERSVTIDTILEEVNNRITSPGQTLSPASAGSENPSFGAFQAIHENNPSSAHPSPFKSPTTPASAMSPHLSGAFLPSGSHQRDLSSQSGFVVVEPRLRRSPISSTERFCPYARSVQPISQDKFPIPPSQPQSPFFSQSSGRFVPPLQSSCWFSLLTLVFYFVKNEPF